jgi:hypothetical protein
MALPTNDDFANRELSIDELEAVAAGGGLFSWFRTELTTLVNELQYDPRAYGPRNHPPLPGGGPGPKGGPYRV